MYKVMSGLQCVRGGGGRGAIRCGSPRSKIRFTTSEPRLSTLFLSSVSIWQEAEGKERRRTLAAPGDELAAVLDELARHLQELLCLVHCEGCVCCVCGLAGSIQSGLA